MDGGTPSVCAWKRTLAEEIAKNIPIAVTSAKGDL